MSVVAGTALNVYEGLQLRMNSRIYRMLIRNVARAYVLVIMIHPAASLQLLET
jgi:hypothetical protein